MDENVKMWSIRLKKVLEDRHLVEYSTSTFWCHSSFINFFHVGGSSMSVRVVLQ
jgi:hypothetical protein